MFVYPMQPVVQPVWQPLVSCKRGLTMRFFIVVINILLFTLLRPMYQYRVAADTAVWAKAADETSPFLHPAKSVKDDDRKWN